MLRIDISDEDIAFGIPGDPEECAITRAIRRLTDLPVLVDRFLITIGGKAYETP